MVSSIAHWINGKKAVGNGNKKYPVYNPATGKITGEVISATTDEINSAINSAKQAFLSWSQITPLKRARVLFQFKAILEKNADKIALLLTHEHGKTLDDAKGEVSRAIELVEFSCGTPYLLQGHYSENAGPQIDTYTLKQPMGICVGITPFNFPVMISTWMFVPAIACGNTFILKPSEKDPSSALLLAELMKEAGLPDGVLTILQGDKEVVDALITHSDVATVSAVGSTPVAEHIYKKAIAHGKRAHTFGGAKNHCVVMPDVDMTETAEAILGAAYGAAGERCMAISVVVAVSNAVADALVTQLQAKIPHLKIDEGTEKNVDMGPLITCEHRDRIKNYIEIGINEDAVLVVDGRNTVKNKKGFFLGPTLFDYVRPHMRIYQEEIFGPVLCVVRVANFDEAIALINAHPFGNGVSLFTQDGGLARNFASQVQVGMVGINVPIPVPVAYHTFGGWKGSLYGDIHMHGAENVHFYTRSKTVTVKWSSSAIKKATYHMVSH